MNTKSTLKRKYEDFNDPEFLSHNEDLVEKEIKKYLEEKSKDSAAGN